MNKKILIITLKLGHNYGGIIQAYALQKVVESLGYDAVTAGSEGSSLRRAVRSVPFLKTVLRGLRGKELRPVPFSVIAQHTLSFIDKHIKTQDINSARVRAVCGAYDGVITGSDQVWRKRYAYLPHTFLAFPSRGARKISYAASFGKENIDEYGWFSKFLAYSQLKSFKKISVREASGKTIVEDTWKMPATVVVDPSLLLQEKDYLKLLPPQTKDDRKGLYFYCLDVTAHKEKIRNRLASELELEIFTLIDGNNNNGKPMPPVEKWIASFRDAAFILTDSFHGMVFSIIFQKPFVVIGNSDRGLARFSSLLKILGLEDRLVGDQSADAVDSAVKISKERIVWSEVSNKLDLERTKSLDYLRDSLP